MQPSNGREVLKNGRPEISPEDDGSGSDPGSPLFVTRHALTTRLVESGAPIYGKTGAADDDSSSDGPLLTARPLFGLVKPMSEVEAGFAPGPRPGLVEEDYRLVRRDPRKPHFMDDHTVTGRIAKPSRQQHATIIARGSPRPLHTPTNDDASRASEPLFTSDNRSLAGKIDEWRAEKLGEEEICRRTQETLDSIIEIFRRAAHERSREQERQYASKRRPY